MNQSSLWLDILSSHTLLPWLLIASVVLVAIVMGLFVLINGSSKLDDGFSGIEIQRWSIKSVIIHWLGAIPCITLILSGIFIGSSKVIFSPGSDSWSSAVHIASTLHEIAAFPFIIGALLMIALWWKNQTFKSYDIDWFKKAGGYINFGTKQHPDAGFANGGEKLWFWVFAINVVLLSFTGVMLFFPELSPSFNNAPFVISIHILSAIVIGAFAVVHIFMATIISEGGLSNMLSGKCDKNWAKQHHNRWYKTLNNDK
ncbi:hypothetical protein MACH09_03460 [Vibrio sp. MACH09]|uniref:formate dehydrogenase subunit gamma n=1 Tax=Vibrio sp. MACH09 TaxID=3025122 RepID=UPI0027906570|nr:formate dehydrogenase subunit gamma [Vibrio sp. MACH09]GLO59838.1 hypothetical protein MACH09_03460 [Vibrio sp. MACH09]